MSDVLAENTRRGRSALDSPPFRISLLACFAHGDHLLGRIDGGNLRGAAYAKNSDDDALTGVLLARMLGNALVAPVMPWHSEFFAQRIKRYAACLDWLELVWNSESTNPRNNLLSTKLA